MEKLVNMRIVLLVNLLFIRFIYFVDSAPQGTEINNQFEDSNHTDTENKSIHQVETNLLADPAVEDIVVPKTDTEIADNVENIVAINNTTLEETATTKVESLNFFVKFYVAIKRPIQDFIEAPKVSGVLKNIGTCVVNGAMEIISFYFPAPLIPLIASAAGMVIPFEPVVMLRKKMPVTSYRRALKTAVNSFMGTFDNFKTSEEDPYMTRKFNRRFMGD